jgi:hypothetical protein
MIPQQNIIAWSKVAPWAEPRQVEQDLIIARAIVQLFGDPFLRGELRFRGGTALNKLHFPKALRYSEDIDLARTKDGASKPIWDRVHDLLDPWLGDPEYFRSQVAPALRYTVAAEDGSSTIRLKVEINEAEITALDQLRACLSKSKIRGFRVRRISRHFRKRRFCQRSCARSCSATRGVIWWTSRTRLRFCQSSTGKEPSTCSAST